MTEVYIPKYFALEELVPRSVYRERGHKGWELLNPNLLRALDELREVFGPIVVNNWAYGGRREWSGLRTEDSPYGTRYSQHRFGNAADCLLGDVEGAREWVLAGNSSYITGVELDTSWLHIDVRNCKKIKTF